MRCWLAAPTARARRREAVADNIRLRISETVTSVSCKYKVIYVSVAKVSRGECCGARAIKRRNETDRLANKSEWIDAPQPASTQRHFSAQFLCRARWLPTNLLRRSQYFCTLEYSERGKIKSVNEFQRPTCLGLAFSHSHSAHHIVGSLLRAALCICCACLPF